MTQEDWIRAIRKASRRSRGFRLRMWIRLGGGQCGPGFEVEKGSVIRWGTHSGIQFGRGVRFGRGVVIDVPRGAVLALGDGVKVMHYSVIASGESITVGARSQIGEHCSIRDSDHLVNTAEAMADALISTPTVVEEDVWIARGVAVLRGASIGRGAVVGANAVVVARHPIGPGQRAVGAPALPVSS